MSTMRKDPVHDACERYMAIVENLAGAIGAALPEVTDARPRRTLEAALNRARGQSKAIIEGMKVAAAELRAEAERSGDNRA